MGSITLISTLDYRSGSSLMKVDGRRVGSMGEVPMGSMGGVSKQLVSVFLKYTLALHRILTDHHTR